MVITLPTVNGLAPEILFFLKKMVAKEFRAAILGQLAQSEPRAALQSKIGNQKSENGSGWAHQDSNLGPRDYESPALTAELWARRGHE